MPVTDMSPARRKELTRHGWGIEAAQEKVRNIINDFSQGHGKVSFEVKTKEIRYGGRQITVYIVPFEVAFFLAVNRLTEQLSFTPYHDEKNDGLWVRWNEEKDKRKGGRGVVKRGATSFKQQYPRKK